MTKKTYTRRRDSFRRSLIARIRLQIKKSYPSGRTVFLGPVASKVAPFMEFHQRAKAISITDLDRLAFSPIAVVLFYQKNRIFASFMSDDDEMMGQLTSGMSDAWEAVSLLSSLLASINNNTISIRDLAAMVLGVRVNIQHITVIDPVIQ